MTAQGTDHRLRQRLLEAAAAILARDGWRGDLLPLSARAAECADQQARVFFERDEDLILAIYARFAYELEERLLDAPAGALAERFRWAMDAKFELVAPYRETLAALAAVMLDPRHELGITHPRTELIRARVQAVFAAVAEGAAKLPAGVTAATMARRLYGLHLMLALLWFQDRTPDSQATRAALDLCCEVLAQTSTLLFSLSPAAGWMQRADSIASLVLSENLDSPASRRSTELLRILFRHRRLLADASCAKAPCPQCLHLHLPRMEYYVRANRPIHLLLPAFPAKSPSRRKTLGPLPDWGETHSLRYLQSICDDLRRAHDPGARITICSDGHVFGDLVSVPDDEISAYGQAIQRIIDDEQLSSLDAFSMEDLFPGLAPGQMREHLERHYAHPLGLIERRIETQPHDRSLFNGIHRFVFEEQADIRPDQSRTQVRAACKPLAIQVIRRSEAWGRLLADCFPAALRLSIHPQHPHAAKIGILMGTASDPWLTPWHGVLVKTPHGQVLMKREEAEAQGARLVHEHDRPVGYELP